jgi:hypothetical protein
MVLNELTQEVEALNAAECLLNLSKSTDYSNRNQTQTNYPILKPHPKFRIKVIKEKFFNIKK